MPTEVERKTSVRRIYAPNDDSTYVDLKVVDEITFLDEKDGFQESVVTLSNNLDADREVAVAEVGDDKLKVERIIKIGHLDERAGFQQTVFTLDNQPPKHEKTHKTKVYALNPDKSKNTDVWIEVERVEKFAFLDEKEGFQETIFTLQTPDLDDPEWDYKDLTTPKYDGHEGAYTINPPYRLDPYQNITDASFGGGVMLVLYETNKIATVTISEAGEFTVGVKRTLEQSSWAKPDWWDDWWDTTPISSFYLKTAQLKLSSTFHPTTCSIKIDDHVISVPSDTLEQRPFYNVADKLNGYAECSTPSYDEGYEAGSFGPSNDPIINGKNNFVWNEYGDKFQWTKANGITRVSVGAVEWPWDYEWDTLSAVDDTGGRWSKVDVLQWDTLVNSGWVSPWTLTQSDAYDYYLYDVLGGYGPIFMYRFGPGDSDFTGSGVGDSGAGSWETSITTKIAVHTKANGLDVLSLPEITVYASYSYDWEVRTMYINYNGIEASYSTDNPSFVAYTYQFPYATASTNSGMYYLVIDNTYGGDHSGTYYTPYESWVVTPASNVFDKNTAYDGWLQVSDGKHMIQGYIKNGTKRLYLDGADKGADLAAAIGCDLEDIITVLMGVKPADVAQLK